MAKIIKFPEALTAKKMLRGIASEHGKTLKECVVVGWDDQNNLILYATSHHWTLLHSASCILADQGNKSLNGKIETE